MAMVWGWFMAWGLPHIEKHHFMVQIYIPRHEATFHGISACFSAMDIGYERDIYWALGNDGQFGTLIFCKTMGNLNSRLFENCWVSSDCPCYPMLEDYDDYLVGGLDHFLFFHILGIIIPTDLYVSEGLNHRSDDDDDDYDYDYDDYDY